MDKGIRVNLNAKFVELNVLRVRGELSNKEFRRDVMLHGINEFNCTVASAATHYNHAFKAQKLADPKSVEGLGRAEDKKGGRKAKPKVVAETAAVVKTEGEETFAYTTVEPALFAVKKKKDGSVVAEGLTLLAAQALCEAAKAAKKATLIWE